MKTEERQAALDEQKRIEEEVVRYMHQTNDP